MPSCLQPQISGFLELSNLEAKMRVVLSILTLLTCLCLSAARADTGASPTGEVILTISGELAEAEQAAEFDMDMLRALPERSFDTSTIWTDGQTRFVGVPLSALLETVGAQGATIRATAINDYAVEIPVSSLSATDPIVAYEMNGEPMSRRQKGPLWIVYPYDSDSRFQTEVIYSRSIWQLDRLEILK